MLSHVSTRGSTHSGSERTAGCSQQRDIARQLCIWYALNPLLPQKDGPALFSCVQASELRRVSRPEREKGEGGGGGGGGGSFETHNFPMVVGKPDVQCPEVGPSQIQRPEISGLMSAQSLPNMSCTVILLLCNHAYSKFEHEP
jgi:hypothetical protein